MEFEFNDFIEFYKIKCKKTTKRQRKLSVCLEVAPMGIPGTKRFSPEYPSGLRRIGIEDFVASP